MAKHTVVVGNIGSVVSDGTWKEASEAYKTYRLQSKQNYGRAAGEDVTWFKDGEPYQEYTGKLTKERARAESAAD